LRLREVRLIQPAIDFAQQLHAQGYRLTSQRQLILEAVRRAETHVTPEQVYDRVHRQQPTISRATIYRTLDFLCEVRLIHALYWGGQMYYEIAGDEPHHHLICRACGGVDQIDHALLNEFFLTIEHQHQFTIDMDHVALFGLCRRCQSGEKKPRD
jgi:Fur family transcriptional regulator, ferric uptake regulator